MTLQRSVGHGGRWGLLKCGKSPGFQTSKKIRMVTEKLDRQNALPQKTARLGCPVDAGGEKL